MTNSHREWRWILRSRKFQSISITEFLQFRGTFMSDIDGGECEEVLSTTWWLISQLFLVQACGPTQLLAYKWQLFWQLLACFVSLHIKWQWGHYLAFLHTRWILRYYLASLYVTSWWLSWRHLFNPLRCIFSIK